MDKTTEKLAVNIKELDKDIARANSFNQVFLRGVLWGVGTVLGATVIAAIIIALLGKILSSVNYISIIRDFIEKIR